MLIVAGTVAIRPEAREKAVVLCAAVVAETKKEAGCFAYDFYSDLADPNLFHVFEEWESREALQAHLQTPHVVAFFTALPDVVAGEPNVTTYDVASSAPL